MLKLYGWLSTLVLAVGVVACVNINTYFPATAVEKAADRIIEEVWDQEEMTPAVTFMSPPVEQEGLLIHFLFIQREVLDFLVAPAAAVEPDFNISNSTIEQIIASLAQRYNTLKPYFQSGAIGLTRDGLVEIREAQQLPLEERDWLGKLITAENGDRKALYRVLARVNRRPEWERQVQETFARRWIYKAPGGWWYQNAQGYWEQKE